MSVFRKAAEFLGLVDDEPGDYPLDDGYLDDPDYGDEPYAAEPPAARARPERAQAVEHDPIRPERVARPVVDRAEPGSGGVTVIRSGARVEAAAVAGAAPGISPRVTPTSSPAVRAVPASAAHVHVLEPASFNDAQEIGDRMKTGQPVIMNLQSNDRELQRRLIDFASGLCYALNGTMSKVADQVFLLTPANVDVTDDEVERLSARGLYRAR